MPEGGLVITQDGLVLVVPNDDEEGAPVAINQSCCCGICPKDFYLACNVSCCTREGCEYVRPSPPRLRDAPCPGDECCTQGNKTKPGGCTLSSIVCRHADGDISREHDGEASGAVANANPRDCKAFGEGSRNACAEEFIASLP